MTTMSIYARAAKATTAEFKKVDSLNEEQARNLLRCALKAAKLQHAKQD